MSIVNFKRRPPAAICLCCFANAGMHFDGCPKSATPLPAVIKFDPTAKISSLAGRLLEASNGLHLVVDD